MRLLRDAAVLIGGLLMVLLVFYFGVPENFFPSRWLSIKKEKQLGSIILETQFVKPIENWTPDNHVDSCVWAITSRFNEVMDTSRYHYNFYLVEDDNINAFALPGGNIVINRGLLLNAENIEEVAAVLAHEIGHVELDHVTDRLLRELGFYAAILLVTGGDGNIVLTVLDEFLSAQYSRQQENEADKYAVHLLHDNGIDPTHLANLFRRLQNKYNGIDEQFELILSHPSMESRISEIEKSSREKGVLYSRSLNFTMDSNKLKQPVTIEQIQ